MDPSILLGDISIQQILLGILSAVFLFFIVMSIILYYHWRKYTERASTVVIAEFIYLTGGAILFSSALILIGII